MLNEIFVWDNQNKNEQKIKECGKSIGVTVLWLFFIKKKRFVSFLNQKTVDWTLTLALAQTKYVITGTGTTKKENLFEMLSRKTSSYL